MGEGCGSSEDLVNELCWQSDPERESRMASTAREAQSELGRFHGESTERETGDRYLGYGGSWDGVAAYQCGGIPFIERCCRGVSGKPTLGKRSSDPTRDDLEILGRVGRRHTHFHCSE